MNSILKYVMYTILLLVLSMGCYGQDFEQIISQGDYYEKKGNYTQAKYYYNLGLNLASEEPTLNGGHQFICLRKIAKQDSLLAYHSIDSDIRRHMLRFDSLAICCSAVWQIVELERVIEMDASLKHPKVMVKILWQENPDIKKQVRILQSKAKREAYVSKLEAHKLKIKEGNKLEGYYGLKSMVSEKHINQDMNEEIAKLEIELKPEIVKYEQYIESGDSLVRLYKDYQAIEQYEMALGLNSECTQCKEQLGRIAAGLVGESWSSKTYFEKLQEARINASVGELITAKKAYQYILRWIPLDSVATDELTVVNQRVKEIQRVKQQNFDIQLKLERADLYFEKKDYSSALPLYKEVLENYKVSMSESNRIKEFIRICEKKIKK